MCRGSSRRRGVDVPVNNDVWSVWAWVSRIVSRTGLRCHVEAATPDGRAGYRVALRCPPPALAEIVSAVETDPAFDQVRLVTALDTGSRPLGAGQRFDLLVKTARYYAGQ